MLVSAVSSSTVRNREWTEAELRVLLGIPAGERIDQVAWCGREVDGKRRDGPSYEHYLYVRTTEPA